MVPAFSFGENELYSQADNPSGSMTRRFQETVKQLLGVSPALFYGRGVFNYSFGFLPHRKPINTVGKFLWWTFLVEIQWTHGPFINYGLGGVGRLEGGTEIYFEGIRMGGGPRHVDGLGSETELFTHRWE